MIKIYYFFNLAVHLFIYLLQKPFASNHACQIFAAKKSFFQLETLPLITCSYAFLKHPIIFVSFIKKSIEFFLPLFRRLSPDKCPTKSLEMNFYSKIPSHQYILFFINIIVITLLIIRHQ